MNIKRLGFAIISSYVAMFVVGMALELLLAGHKPQSKALGRIGADLEAHTIWMFLGYFIFTILFCYIYAHHHEDKGWKEGARYGFLVGLMMAGFTMVLFAAFPFNAMETFLSAMAGIVIYIAGGIATALVYKKDG